ncbi:MAG: hypothetical protein ABIJ75_11785 [Actinomycetota bacterium]
MLEALRELKPEDQIARIDQAWENLVLTEDGQIVLGVLLEELGLLNELKGPEEMTRHNVAVVILTKIKRNKTRLLLEALVERKG